MAQVTLALLGPFDLRVDGRSVAVSSRRVRALLAALALPPGRVVRLDSLAEQVWDGQLPVRTRSSLQTLANRLRALVGSGTVRTELDGYRLDVPPEAVDVTRFQRLLDAARGGDPARARALVGEALALWRGEPLTGAGSDLLDREVRPVLLERCLTALEWRVDLDLELGGRPAELAAELQELASRYPMREPLWARLMTAMHRAGRPAEALDTYQAIRTRLVEELGADPSAELQRVYGEVLAGDAGPARPAAPAGSRSADPLPAPPVPRQLPPRNAGFVGRAADLAALDAALEPGDGPPPSMLALHGTGGVGKTALALHWAHRVTDRFPDGQLYLDLRGYGPGEPMDPAAALDVVLRALGVPAGQVPPSRDERSGLLRSWLAGRRLLLVLDNARDAGQVRPLVPGGANLVLVTSRNELRGLEVRDGAVRRRLRELPADDSLSLLRIAIGAERADAEPAAVAELARLCGRLPLALVVAGERAARFTGASVAELVGELRTGRDRLDALADPDDPAIDPRVVFSWSYRALDAGTARTFRRLGLHPGPTVELPAAAALLGAEPGAARLLLDRLVSVHLLEQVGRDRYRFHDLLRDYAAERAAEEPAADRALATRRMLDFYLHTLHRARETVFSPMRTGPDDPVDGTVRPLDFRVVSEATAWYDANDLTLPAVLEEAARLGHHRHGWQLSQRLWVFQDFRYQRDAALGTARVGLRCALRLGDEHALALAWHAMGAVLSSAGAHDEAMAWKRRALEVAERLGDHGLVSTASGAIGLDCESAGRPGEAVAWMARSVAAARRTDRPVRLAHALLNLGHVEVRTGRLDAAIEHNHQALELYERHGSAYNQAQLLSNLAETYLARGDHHKAIESADRALALAGDVDDPTVVAAALTTRGEALAATGDETAARESWQRALTILERAQDPSADRVRTLLDRP
jgi:DNA-binding SARP family transcriptional activator/tetratricopeptide (TPR) repeat protein